MKEYRIISTEVFFKNYILFFDKTELEKFNKFKERLKFNPYLGDMLRIPFFREFKTNKGKRAYFLIYDKIQIVLFVAYSNKKEQKYVINRIFEKLKEFETYVHLINFKE